MPVHTIEVISQTLEYFCGWPTLLRRATGELLVAYSGGRERHVCPFGRFELVRSQDGGRSWSWPEVLMDSPIDDRGGGLCETAKGTLLATSFTSIAYLDRDRSTLPPETLPRWAAADRRATPEQRKALLGTWMLRSTNGGMTWSAPYRVPVDSPHGAVVVSGGRLLYAGKQLWDPASKNGVCESTDDGLTWRWLADIPTRPGDDPLQYHELHAVEAADRRILVQIRNHNKPNQNETLQCESEDGGKTWSMPHGIGVWGYPSHLLRLHDGRLLMSYSYRRDPFGNQARISQDHGRTWSPPLVISDDGAGDLGYPSTVEMPDGLLLTVWYERMMKGVQPAVLRMARWSI